MEVNSSKQLHKHAAPIALLFLALFTLSAITLTTYQNDNTSLARLARGLVTQVLHIQPAANGLSKITTKPTPPSLTSDIDQTGQSAQLTFLLQ